MRIRLFEIIFFVVCLLLTTHIAPPNVTAQSGNQIERVSVASDGTQGNADSYHESISADGRFVAFVSDASNLVSGDTNDWPDIFVHDRQTGQTSRVSIASDGSQANLRSGDPSISADGRFVAFESDASNLVSCDTLCGGGIFVHDRYLGLTSMISVSPDGIHPEGSSWSPSISADGRFVTFTSSSNDITNDNAYSLWDVFIRDRHAGQTSTISLAFDGTPANSVSNDPSISADGRYVAFYSYASNLVIGDTNSNWDLFVRDRYSGQTSRVWIAPAGTQWNSPLFQPAISADGHFIAFHTAYNLVSDDTNAFHDVFVRDQLTGQISRVSVASDGTQGNADSEYPSISADGRFVTFYSNASNLVSGDTNNYSDIFVHDRQTGQTNRVSVASNGTQANNLAEFTTISADGRFVTFGSWATNLVSGDTNNATDIFVAAGPREQETPPICGIPNANPRIITFAGQQWYVKNGVGGPEMNSGPNHFSDSVDSVWVDTTGALHLKIRKVGNTWYSAEVCKVGTAQYGMHRFTISTPDLNENVVLGLFNYKDLQNEIDIEMAEWGDPNDPNKMQYVVQPWNTPGNMIRFPAPTSGDTTHYFDWCPANIQFRSFQGHALEAPTPTYQWLYTAADNPPQSENLRTHINLWLIDPPTDGQPAEVTINDFDRDYAMPTLLQPASNMEIYNPNVNFTWQPAANITKYRIQIAQNATFTNPLRDALVNNSSYMTQLDTGAYYWRVQGLNCVDVPGAWTPTRQLIIHNLSVPILHYFITPTPTLTWNHVSWATSYEIEIDATPSFNTPGHYTRTINGLSHIVEISLSDGIWYWRIRAIGANGAGSWSPPERFVVDAP